MEKNTFERVEKDPPQEKCVCIERDTSKDYCAKFIFKPLPDDINPNSALGNKFELEKKICEDTAVVNATSKSKTTKKRTAKVHSKAQ